MKTIGFSRILPGVALALAALLATAVNPLQAQTDPAATYPNKPIRVIVGFAAGGGNDIFARLVGARLSEILGQPVVIENRAAAGGRLAADFVANQAPADGYTLLVGATGMMSIASAIAIRQFSEATQSIISLLLFHGIMTPGMPVLSFNSSVAIVKAGEELA